MSTSGSSFEQPSKNGHNSSRPPTPRARQITPLRIVNRGAERPQSPSKTEGAPPLGPTHAFGGADDDRDSAVASMANNIRQTVEYKVAWDLELWRAIEASKLRQQLETQKKKALNELARVVKIREQQAVAGLEVREQEVARREQRLREEEKQMERRKWRLAEMEKDVRCLRQHLTEARRRVGADAKAEVRRAKEDAEHAAELQEQRMRAAEAQAKRADERLQQAQREYLALSEEFHHFRTRQLTAPPDKLSTVEARMRSEFVIEQQALHDRLERRHQEKLQQVEDRCRKLEEENCKLLALSTKRKEQLNQSAEVISRLKRSNRALKERLEARVLGAAGLLESSANVGMKPNQEDAQRGPEDANHPEVALLSSELERLQHERRLIVEGSAGALDEGSDIVRCLDSKIKDLIDQLATHGQVLHPLTVL